MNDKVAALIDGAGRIIRGKREFLELLCTGILAGGHVLLDDKPGLGKTTAAKTIAALIGGGARPGGGLSFKRIQFTPDLLPYDITGVDVFDAETRSFRFVPGPVLSNIVLADEINRTTPKVQSALLEVMAERQVTIGSASHKTGEPFFVIATQNPVESEGTFPLPAAQLDRFMLRLSLGYPDRDAEIALLNDTPSETALRELEPVISVDDFLAACRAAMHVFCHDALKEAIADIVRETRVHKNFSLGASPRAALHFLAAARAFAFIRGRAFVTDEDLAKLAVPVLSHRLKLRDPRGDGSKLVRDIALSKIESIDVGRLESQTPEVLPPR
ncbi:MAG: AAA family ATPase [Spirochaetaceae bacterium]|jgi:MoxR-like ATPase|nr:AAA family ATPase [Spirochaetaceae bacterium]